MTPPYPFDKSQNKIKGSGKGKRDCRALQFTEEKPYQEL